MDEITKLLTLITKDLGRDAILAFQGSEPPEKPYVSTQILSVKPTKRRGKREALPDLMVGYETVSHVNCIMQFDCIGNNILESKELAFNLYDCFNSRKREEIWSLGIGVVKIGTINERTYLRDNAEYEHISSIDITIEYERISKHTIENLNSIVLEGLRIERKK